MRPRLIQMPQILLGAALTAGTVALSRVPWTAEREDAAVIRLAWRYRSALTEQCRRRSAEELAKLPQHMRREMDCTRRLQPYRLEAVIDGDTLRDSVAARGATSDRPLSVFREAAVAPGQHRLRLVFAPYGTGAESLHIDTSFVLEVRRIAVVTIEGERLVLKTAR